MLTVSFCFILPSPPTLHPRLPYAIIIFTPLFLSFTYIQTDTQTHTLPRRETDREIDLHSLPPNNHQSAITHSTKPEICLQKLKSLLLIESSRAIPNKAVRLLLTKRNKSDLHPKLGTGWGWVRARSYGHAGDEMMATLTWGSQVQRCQSAEVLACEVTTPAVEKIYDLALSPADGNVQGSVTVLVRHRN